MEKRKLSRLEWLDLVFDGMPIGVLAVDQDLTVIDINRTAEHMTGYARKEAIGKPCAKVLRGEMCETRCPLRKVMNTEKREIYAETLIQDKEGRKFPVRVVTKALFDESGKLLGGVEVFHDITEIKTLERERSNILSLFAHDMKSPLVSIQGFILRLQKKIDELTRKRQFEYLEIIRTEAQKLENLMNEFLEFSKLQQGIIQLDLSATDLDKEIMELIQAYEAKFNERGVKLAFLSDEKTPTITADSKKLRRVFENLLENALKFSLSRGVVSVELKQTDLEIMVFVKDQGIGISQEDLPYIFDSFYKGHGSENHTGYGLGLAGVRSIVEAHGGRVLVSSEPGKGTVFTVALPIRRNQAR